MSFDNLLGTDSLGEKESVHVWRDLPFARCKMSKRKREFEIFGGCLVLLFCVQYYTMIIYNYNKRI
jgi:hypothetical protein